MQMSTAITRIGQCKAQEAADHKGEQTEQSNHSKKRIRESANREVTGRRKYETACRRFPPYRTGYRLGLDSNLQMDFRHRQEPARSCVLAMAKELGLAVRSFSEGIRYCGDFYGQTDEGLPHPEGVGVENLLRILRSLSPGCTELACHPGYGSEMDTMYGVEREQEIKTLCDPSALKAVTDMDIDLVAFGRK